MRPHNRRVLEVILIDQKIVRSKGHFEGGISFGLIRKTETSHARLVCWQISNSERVDVSGRSGIGLSVHKQKVCAQVRVGRVVSGGRTMAVDVSRRDQVANAAPQWLLRLQFEIFIAKRECVHVVVLVGTFAWPDRDVVDGQHRELAQSE